MERGLMMLAVLSGCSFKSAGSSEGAGRDHDTDIDEVTTPSPTDDDAGGVVDDGEAVELDAGRPGPPDAGPSVGNDGGDEPVIMDAWPGGSPSTVDRSETFGENLSGLTFQPATSDEPAVLWAVQNNPSRLYRLERDDDGLWTPARGAFREGIRLVYPDGDGGPDAEGVTLADGSAIYVASERDDRREDESRPSILRYDLRDESAPLTATHEWNLTDDLPAVDANEGIEAVTWVPDAHLVLHHFHDEARNEPYDPARYPDHGGGLFFVGLEANGVIYAYALDHDDSSAVRVASLESGQAQVMGLEFDGDRGMLWAHCDDGCGNRTSVLTIAPAGTEQGQFVVRAIFDPPAELAELNDEGIALSPCEDGERSFFWADDNQTDGHALRESVLPCD